MKRTVAFTTLGCKVNQNETEALSALFRERGYEQVEFAEKADIYIINTCTVTHLADRKSRQIIRRATRTNPQAKVVVMGCYAQMSPQEVQKIPGVNLVVGTSERSRIVDLLEELDREKESLSLVRDISIKKDFEDIDLDKNIDRARAYLKVQEGCQQFCSYCIIPYARGPVRSRALDNALREAKKLMEAGFREVVLTGIHLGAYGRDLGQGINLESLLQNLLPLNPEVRWRLSSLEPTEVSAELIEMIKDHQNLCPHLHLPLQSGHDEILESMKRPYTTGQYREVIQAIRSAVPHICITTDVMVGFPGETEEHFRSYLDFLEELALSDLHVFQYSPRKGTPAAGFPRQVPSPLKEKRSRRLIRLAGELWHNYAARFLGHTLEVLVEKDLGQGNWEGHSANYLKVQFPSGSVKRGDIVPVKLREVGEKICFGALTQRTTP